MLDWGIIRLGETVLKTQHHELHKGLSDRKLCCFVELLWSDY